MFFDGQFVSGSTLAIIVLTIMVISGSQTMQWYLWGSAEAHLQDVFPGISTTLCCARAREKLLLREHLESENPSGILFINGK
jgi:hypothetical protein